LISLAGIIYFIINEPRNIVAIWGGIVISAIVILLVLEALKNNLNILKIDDNGVKLRNAFVEINKYSWHEIKNIYVYQFVGTDRIKVPYKVDRTGTYKQKNYGRYNVGGKIVFVPRRMPTKWIFIDDGCGDNGENILEYLVPLKKGAVVRLLYNDDIISALEKNYQKEIIKKQSNYKLLQQENTGYCQRILEIARFIA